MKKLLFLPLFFFVAVFSGQAQNPDEDLRKMMEKYLSFQDLSYDISYQRYEREIAGQPLETMQGKIRMAGEKRHQRIGQTEIIQTQDYSILADHKEKRVVFSPLVRIPDQDGKEVPLPSVDMLKMLDLCEIESHVKEGKLEVYTLLSPYLPSGKLRLFYDPKTLLIREMQLFYGKEPYEKVDSEPVLVMQLTNYAINTGLPASVFSSDQFLVKQNGKLSLRPKYKGYTYYGPDQL